MYVRQFQYPPSRYELVWFDGTVFEFSNPLELIKILDNLRRWIDLTTLGPMYYWASTIESRIWR